jgi:hypothetical protein
MEIPPHVDIEVLVLTFRRGNVASTGRTPTRGSVRGGAKPSDYFYFDPKKAMLVEFKARCN